MQKEKLQYLIWGLSILIVLQAGFITLRFYQYQQKKTVFEKEQQEKIKAQEEIIKEELKAVPEPEVKVIE